MGDRDRRYWLKGLVEVNDALVGGKRGRGVAGKKSVVFAVERRGNGTGYLAVQAVECLDLVHVRDFSRRLVAGGAHSHRQFETLLAGHIPWCQRRILARIR